MSKTTQEKKAKKALEEQSQVEALSTVEGQKAVEEEAVADTTPDSQPETTEVITETPKAEKKARVRGKKYQDAKKKIDINKYYPLKEAIELTQKTSISKFEGKIEAHITASDIGAIGEITFPHLETGSKKIVVLNDTILSEIKDSKINFDILIATPATMPKLLPFARVLGPKGLMPNPKNGTLTDDPETAQKRLAVAKTPVRTEKKAPIIHMVVGKVSQPANEIKANVEELIKVIKAQKIKKLVLSATMGPGVKVAVEK